MNDRAFWFGLLLGSITGALATALLAPQSGSEVREQVAERGVELRHRAEDVIHRAQIVANETVARVQASAHELLRQESARPTDGAS